MKPPRRLREHSVEVHCTGGAWEGSRSLLEGSVEELRGVPTMMMLVIVLGQYDTVLLAMSY